MIHLEEFIHVSRPIADCFRYIQDFSTIEQWDPGVYRSSKITAGTPRVGTRFAVTINSAGRRLPMEYVIQELIPEKLVLLVGEGSGVRAVDRIEFESLGEGPTRIRYQADLTLAAAPPVAEPFLKPGGLVFAMKAKRADEELATVSTERWRLLADRFVLIPNSTAERRLLVFTPHAKITP
jgi:hypothetical protein